MCLYWIVLTWMEKTHSYRATSMAKLHDLQHISFTLLNQNYPFHCLLPAKHDNSNIRNEKLQMITHSDVLENKNCIQREEVLNNVPVKSHSCAWVLMLFMWL